jgi:hypothetical protein
MTHHNSPIHFKGKDVAGHLKEARQKGAYVATEIHGTELPGHLSAGFDSAKETALILTLLWILFAPSFQLLALFSIGWLIWKTGRSALLGWARLERLHRVIEEERYEIEHHREQERSELKELYAAKGFEGKLLDDVIEVLMADDNRLLQVMLEEELGLSLEVHQHPLKQASGALIGTLLAAGLALLFHFFWPILGIPLAAFITILLCSSLAARSEKRAQMLATIWNLSLALFGAASVYFLAKLLVVL